MQLPSIRKIFKKIGYVMMGVGLFLLLLFYVFFGSFYYFQTLAVIALLIAFVPIITINYMEYRRIKAIELYLADFLRNVSESIRSGMTLERAMDSASCGHYGPLSEEMKITSAQISWGISFEEALERFSNRINSKLVRQALLIILESYKSGGEVADILETVSTDIRLLKEVETKRKGELQIYVVSTYFIFFLFLAIIIVLSKSFLPATPQLGALSSIVGGTAPTITEEEYKTFFFHLVLIEAFFAGILCGQMGEGRIIAGFKHSFILVVISLLTFQFALAPEPFANKIATEILKLPSGTEMVSTEAPYTLFSDVTSAQIAEIVKAAAKEKKTAGFEQLEAKNIFFSKGDCKPCEREDITLETGFLLVKRPAKIYYTIASRKGNYVITIRG
jgi:flagellar protein FlaJ